MLLCPNGAPIEEANDINDIAVTLALITEKKTKLNLNLSLKIQQQSPIYRCITYIFLFHEFLLKYKNKNFNNTFDSKFMHIVKF